MSNYLLVFLMFCAGATVAIQPAINARLALKVGVVESACISFVVGTVALLAVSLGSGRGNWRGISETVWWEWSGGLFGAFFVTAAIVALPRIGVAATMAAVIAAQLATGVLMDHYGAFGMAVAPFGLRRLLGVVLLLVGAALVCRR